MIDRQAPWSAASPTVDTPATIRPVVLSCDVLQRRARARRVAVLEERMNTMQADLSATLERFRADMASMMRETAALLGGMGIASGVIIASVA